ncbi:thioredoxin domain-containing protein [Leifsonia sp. F6_8S_P_1B]|uniref:Thioredoxin domain-containing protein n=1 Tax=Leifsonia williamsii TaxID=3035919 RepID=A0ABT8KG18_9MICO|nr:thioredoxin domain-containing protein [Leifsonia williamsii]MDN4615952.1 thioredoxin domain-containing protein [Leifsonia williamsii]
MATGRGASSPSKRDRREEARETARKMREEAAKKAKRRKVIVQSSVIVGIVAVLAIVGVVIFTSVSASSNVANPKNMLSGGILLEKADKAVTTPAIASGAEPTATKQTLDGKTAHIQIWLDYQCPYCNQFETTNSDQMKQMMADGSATLEIHPVAILDSSQNKEYATRAAAAASCVANYEPNKFFDVNSALFANQPDEQTGTGLTNEQILGVFKDAGVESDAITKCVNDQTYAKFITNRTQSAVKDKQLVNPSTGSFGTPTVFVNGQRYQGGFTDADQFKAFVAAAVKDAGDSGSVTFPTPGK